jgi:trehalose 6-phosphate synthase
MRLVVCSNSAPRWQEDVGLLPRSPGGLVPLLADLLGSNGGDWVCTAPPGSPPPGGPMAGGRLLPGEPLPGSPLPGGSPHRAHQDGQPGSPVPPSAGPVTVTSLPGGIRLHQVHQPAAVAEQHYEVIGVRLMLWLFHYLLDTASEPVFDRRFAQAWAGYEAVNRAYASYLGEVLANSPDELLLVNDYHLFLVPEMLGQAAGRSGRLVFFHGLPWCEPEYFGILPAAIRDRILASLLCCDVVGFHCTRWARAFAACCERYLPGCHVSDASVVSGGHETRLAVAPFPLDAEAVERMRGQAATARWDERLGRMAAGRRVIVRADRIDLWKNLPRGFAAYTGVLERDPGLAREWWFCAVATTPSRTTERSRDLQRRCEDMVAGLNDRFGAPGRPAVSLVYPELATTRNCVVAALSRAGVTLVNPTFDGMNLVAKEALYLADAAPLLLSENAGAFERLAGQVTPLRPFDVEATAAAMSAAMSGEAPARQASDGQARGGSGRELLCGQGTAGWLSQLTGPARPAVTGRSA